MNSGRFQFSYFFSPLHLRRVAVDELEIGKVEKSEMGSSSDNFSVFVLASDLVVDARPFLTNTEANAAEQETWHDCSQYLPGDEDFSDLELLQFIRLQGSDKNGNRICRIVGKYFPGNLIYRLPFLIPNFCLGSCRINREVL